tara:strand:- start:142 stop:1053 length:912 start_codon:yes stop_codon:yes gene_type:complete
MNVAFFTEMNFTGMINRDHTNMRTEFAWMCALEATHYPINSGHQISYDTKIDLGIIIIPKNNPIFDIKNIKSVCNKVAVMQEGPNWLWQDYPLEQQIWYYNTLMSADIIYTHNKSDQQYYKGLTNHSDVRVMPSLMIEDSIQPQLEYEQSGVMIGGNMSSWYGGFDSMIVAQEFREKIYAPSMGRKIEREEELDINHLPYMNWTQWIYELRKVKYAVHLMRTHAAGTFALNCAYLGIPCIGYKGLDTQELCHPETTVEVGDLVAAKEIAKKLKEDTEFYKYCSDMSKQRYQSYYHESKFNIGE